MTELSQKTEIAVGMADLKVGQAPTTIATNLGSCIGVCLYSEGKKAGGLLHLMLPNSNGANPATIKEAKYADTGIPKLLRELKKSYGIEKSELTAKIFGGGKILKGMAHNIGDDNEKAVREILKSLGIRIIAAKTGGEKGYRVSFELDSGKIKCQIFGEPIQEF